jgi:hypothetical protein
MHDLIQIKAVVEDAYNGIDISTKTRKIPHPDAVKIYSYIATGLTEYGTTEISRFINRSHSTISVAVKTCEDIMEVDKSFREKVRYCTQICANILNLNTATHKERIDIIFTRLSSSQQEELYMKAQDMFALNNGFKKEIHYVN